MSEHAIRWEFDHGGVMAQAICLAAPDADCHLTSVTCECERWGEIDHRDDGTIWHHITDYGDSLEPVWHRVELMDDCNVCLFINESGCVEELGHGSFVIAETPIRPVWLDDGCDWEPMPNPPAPEASAGVGEGVNLTDKEVAVALRILAPGDEDNVTLGEIRRGLTTPPTATSDPAGTSEQEASS